MTNNGFFILRVNYVYKMVYDLQVSPTYITPWIENYINSCSRMNWRKLWEMV
jgi:hypothetical protein